MFKEEEDHIRETLLRCNYSTWALNRLQTKINHRHSTIQAQNQSNRHKNNNNNNNNNTNTHNMYIVVPYTIHSEKVLRMSVIKLEYKFTLREETLSGTSGDPKGQGYHHSERSGDPWV